MQGRPLPHERQTHAVGALLCQPQTGLLQGQPSEGKPVVFHRKDEATAKVIHPKVERFSGSPLKGRQPGCMARWQNQEIEALGRGGDLQLHLAADVGQGLAESRYAGPGRSGPIMNHCAWDWTGGTDHLALDGRQGIEHEANRLRGIPLDDLHQLFRRGPPAVRSVDAIGASRETPEAEGAVLARDGPAQTEGFLQAARLDPECFQMFFVSWVRRTISMLGLNESSALTSPGDELPRRGVATCLVIPCFGWSLAGKRLL